MRSAVCAGAGDMEGMASHAARAVELGANFGDRDIQARALTNQGEALVQLGRLEEGMALYDEASVAAVGGELSPFATGIVYCNTIGICSEVADYGRAAEWTDAARRWCQRQAISGFPGFCRVRRAEIVRLRGAWPEAEREARVAAEELTLQRTVSYAAGAFVELGLVRLRMGDLQSAAAAFGHANELGASAQPGLALLDLARGEPSAALIQVRRALEDDELPLVRARTLPAAVEIALAAGDVDVADAASTELAEIAAAYGTPMLRAIAEDAAGAVLLARGDVREAVKRNRAAYRIWRELDAPYETARLRERLGLSYRASGDERAAVLELDAARAAYERLGASLDLQRVLAVLGRAAPAPRRVTRTFMFTDIVGSTGLIATVGDDAWNDLRRWHDQVLRASFAAHDGEEVDHPGDGFFIAFPDAAGALECAVGIQRLLAEHRQTHGFAPRVRIGLHADSATQEAGTYQGLGVHAAARIGALAEGGDILATAHTVIAAGGEWPVSDEREVELRGLEGRVRVMSIRWHADPAR